ncbi:hypothetical protein ACFL6S_37225 [Candidatus Poribacteria bacterium]
MAWRIYLVLAALVLVLLISTNVNAFIFREYELDEVVQACSNVISGKTVSIDPKTMSFAIDQIKTIRGEEQFKQIKISLAVGRGAFPAQLMGKLRADAPIVVFYIPVGQERLEALGYVSNVWIRLFAVRDSSGKFKWHFTHIEKYMNRTFDGATSELQSLIQDIPAKEEFHSSTNIDAFVRHRYTLEEVVRTCSNVVSGKVTAIDKKKMYIVISEMENIKGKEQIKQMKINLATGQADSSKQLIDKLRAGVPMVVFYVPVSGKRIEALGYVSNAWLRLFAVYDNSKALEWYFAHIEKYMNHVFEGDALKLQSLIRDIVAEKKTVRAKPPK